MDNREPVEIASSGTIDAPVNELWALVSDFGNVARWHPDVTSSRLESGSVNETGSVRSIRLRSGMSLRERLLAISEQELFYTYSVIESPLPIRDHESTVRFTRLSDSRTNVTWTARFSVVEGTANEFAAAVKAGVLDLGIEGLRRATASKGPVS
jgi:uncharacterized protein YndB with AHSA1/START domain